MADGDISWDTLENPDEIERQEMGRVRDESELKNRA